MSDWVMRGAAITGVALALVVSRPAAAASVSATCLRLAADYDARRATLEPPQVSAALFAAADEGCDALASRLLDAGASVGARDRVGGAALSHAARGGHDAVVRVLAARGAEVDLRNVEGSAPLYVAVENNRLKAAEALLALGANADLPGRAGVTPLAAAAYNGNLPMVELLLAHKADPATRDVSGKAALLYAAARGFAPIVARLLAAGVDVNATYGHDLTLLSWAAGYADDVPVDDGLSVVTLVLDRGAGLDAVDDRGRTALMTAASLGHDEVAELLLRRGADPARKDRQGKTAADLATSATLRALLAAAHGP